jgi:hypothetical protein
MKVYVTFEKDGYNGEQIEKVFISKKLAQDWIIDSRFDQPLYHGKERHELEEKALYYIEECNVAQECE